VFETGLSINDELQFASEGSKKWRQRQIFENFGAGRQKNQLQRQKAFRDWNENSLFN